MKIFQTPSYDRFCLSDIEKEPAKFKSMQDVPDYGKAQAANVVISDEGMNALRRQLKEMKPDADEVVGYELTIQDTNEVEWEHYNAMREYSSLTLKDGNYNLEDVMKSMMDAYETCYNQIVKAHENGERQVSYDLSGENKLTLEEDLAGLDRAYRMRLANLEGYITCQQTNDGVAYFKRTNPKDYAMKDKEYRDTAVTMMEQAQKRFLELRDKSDYKEGMAKEIIWNIMSSDVIFMESTQKLFAKTIHYNVFS